MGCGAISKPKHELTEEEQTLIDDGQRFRLKVINEVMKQRSNNRDKQAGEVQGDDSDCIPKLHRVGSNVSAASACTGYPLSRVGSNVSKKSEVQPAEPRTQEELQQFRNRKSCPDTILGRKSLTVPGANRHSEGAALAPARPLKTNSHKSRNSVTEAELVGVASLTVNVPGKVGLNRDLEALDLTNSHMIMKTRKVHKTKDHAKKVYAQRRLGSIEYRSEESLGEGEEPGERLKEEDKKQLMKSVQRHFLFSSLSKSEQQMLLDQMIYQENGEGDKICTKGQKGDACYMIISGICKAERDGVKVFEFSAGDLFGELSMLYDVPRTACVVAVSPKVVLGVIRGNTFRKSLAMAKERTLSDTLEFLNHHKTFCKLSLDEKMMLANALNFKTFAPGALLIDDGLSHTCEWMFLVQEGSVEVHDEFRNHKVLGPGGTISGRKFPYGNHAVLAKALSNVKCLSIGYAVMNRLFGNISEVLRISTIRSFLEPLSFFPQLSDKQQSIIGRCFQEQKVSKGDIIVSALADPQLVLVLEGEASVIDLSENACVHSPSGRIESLKELAAECETIIQSRRGSGSSSRPTDSFAGLVPSDNAGSMTIQVSNRDLELSCGEPESEVPPLEAPEESISPERDTERKPSSVGPMPSSEVKGEVRRLRRGDFFGEETFNDDGRMPYSLVAASDGLVSRTSHEAFCRALHGNCEKAPSLAWILLKNQVKKRLHEDFPFSALYDEMLDVVVEDMQRIEYAPAEKLAAVAEDTMAFFLIIEGEAVLRREEGEDPNKKLQGHMEAMERWATFGTRQMLLGDPCDSDINAAASGCTILSLSHEAFFHATGVLCHELQTKMIHKSLNLTWENVISEGILGQGQFGVVRRVAITSISQEDAPEGFALKSMSKKRVIDLEQSAPCKLEREILDECCHPLIVRMIASFQDEFCVHLLMETLSGGDLFTAIRDIGTLNENHMLFYGASILLGIEYIHSRGIVYRDLKPENIMLTGDGFLKIVDFGCCTKKQRSYTFTGTPEYLAPEVILGKGYGKAVDWWGLGVIMYEMICGPLPFGEGCADPLAVMKEVLEKELVFPAQVKGDKADLLTSLLERKPEQRLGTSTSHWQSEVRQHAFFEDLHWDAIIEQSTPPPYVPPATQHEPKDEMGENNSIRSGDSGQSDNAENWEKEPLDPNSDITCFADF